MAPSSTLVSYIASPLGNTVQPSNIRPICPCSGSTNRLFSRRNYRITVVAPVSSSSAIAATRLNFPTGNRFCLLRSQLPSTAVSLPSRRMRWKCLNLRCFGHSAQQRSRGPCQLSARGRTASSHHPRNEIILAKCARRRATAAKSRGSSKALKASTLDLEDLRCRRRSCS